MRRACRQVEPLLARAARQLDERERGMLWNHLEGCEDCRARDRVFTELFVAAREPLPLSQTARERAMSRAFERAAAQPRSIPAAPKRTIGLTLAVAAAAALVVGLRLVVMAPATETASHSALPAPSPVQSAAPATSDDALAAAPEDDAPYEAKTLERRAFAGAEVTLGAGSRVRFQKDKSTVVVARGEVSFAVEKRSDSPFVVTTQNFRVEVLGTQFSVSPDRVSVSHGRVAVRSTAGDALLAELGAGESYVFDEASEPARTAPDRDESVAQLLVRAREALGRTNVALARTLLSEIETKRSSRREQAEAGTLQAECALVEHDAPRAIRSYLEVARRFAALPAGENAAFAAAQLSARTHGDERARALYQQYVTRYPEGRFADEARAHLRAPVGQ